MPPRLRRSILRIIAVAACLYVLTCTLLVWQEHNLLYQPFSGPSEPAAAGLADFTRRELPQPNGTAIMYWENTATPGHPTIFYLHGNGGGLHYHARYISHLAKAGFHIVAMEYPGYPSVPGTPSQSLIVSQAIALFDATKSAAPNTPIVIWGFSLGSGVASQLAAERPPAALVLEAPFTATVDRAAEIFPIFPVHRLMRDQYRSREAIKTIHAPLFIMHGDADIVIPIHHGKTLFALANEPKTFRLYKGAGHLDLMTHGAYEDAAAWINTLNHLQPRNQ